MSKHGRKNFKKAFSLIELLISVIIILSVISVVMLIEQKNITFTTAENYQTQANGLVLAGSNIVKSLIDSNKLDPTISGTCANPSDPNTCEPGLYYIDEPSGGLIKCTSCRDQAGTSQTCPELDGVNTTNLSCADPGAQRGVDGTMYNQTIIISEMCVE